MAEMFEVKIIARIHSDFPSKFGIPRQSGLVENLQSLIVFEPEYRSSARRHFACHRGVYCLYTQYDRNFIKGIERFLNKSRLFSGKQALLWAEYPLSPSGFKNFRKECHKKWMLGKRGKNRMWTNCENVQKQYLKIVRIHLKNILTFFDKSLS